MIVTPIMMTLVPISATNNSVGSRTAAAGNMSAAIVAHLAHSGHSRTDAVICNWKGIYSMFPKPSSTL